MSTLSKEAVYRLRYGRYVGYNIHIITQPRELLSAGFLTDNATFAASLKASFTPRFFMAEHSGHSQEQRSSKWRAHCMYQDISVL
jgi:hypothetical protein